MSAGPEMKGPFPTSNWILPKKLLWGDVPSQEKMPRLSASGVNLFVDLRLNGTPSVPNGRGVRYVHFPVQNHMNGTPVQNDALRDFVGTLLSDIQTPTTVAYVYCQDGYSVSALVVCGVLAGHYGMSGMKAMNVTAQLHSCRDDRKGADTVFTPNTKTLARECFTNFAPTIKGEGLHSYVAETDAPHDQDAMLGGTHGGSLGGTQRFANTKGHGGGESTVNIFDQTSPSKITGKGGRKFIQGHAPGGGGAVSAQLFDTQSSQLSSSRGSPAMDRGAYDGSMTPKPNQVDRGHNSGRSVISNVQQFFMTRPSVHTPWGLDLDGITVMGVAPNSVAERAGLIPGDIVSLNGLDITQEVQLTLLTEFTEVDVGIRPGHRSQPGRMPHQVSEAPPPSVRGGANTTPSPVVGGTADFNLPPLLDARRDQSAIKGPISTTNWVIRGSVLCGNKPNPRDRKKFHALIDTGISVFVNLTEDADCSYIEAAEVATRRTFSALCFPIEDGGVPPPSQVPHFHTFINDVLEKILSGHIVYVHCKEGHGRTGIVVSILLARLYRLPPIKAIGLCSGLHKGRVEDGGVDSPANLEQRTFVSQFIGS